LVGWAAEPRIDDWSTPHEKNATDRHANAAGPLDMHHRRGGVRQQLLFVEDHVDIDRDADVEHDADEHDDHAQAQVQTGLLAVIAVR
jgi:hypothetical protein